MIERWPIDRARWRAACWLGLVSSTFSTVVSSLTGARVGRDILVDWMSVAAIPVRDAAFALHPPAWAVAVGVAFHQWADFSWALVFFGLLGRWTARLGPWPLLAVALAWSVGTSSLEWLVLVPMWPFRQPVFPLEQVYWLGFFVHASSALAYPLFPWIHDRVLGRRDAGHARFARRWSVAGAAAVGVLGVASVLGASGHEPAWIGHDAGVDRAFLRRMAAHHAQGAQLAAIAAERARDPHLRALAMLIGASQLGEIDIFRQWWRGWFGGALPDATMAEHTAMPGMLTDRQWQQVVTAEGDAFDRRFIDAMSWHHAGAIAMCDDALKHASDPRVVLMAHAIRHAQTGEIALLHGVPAGWPAVRIALRSLLRSPDSPP